MTTASPPYSLIISAYTEPVREPVRFRVLREGVVTVSDKLIRVYRDWMELGKLDLVFRAEDGEFSDWQELALTALGAHPQWVVVGTDEFSPRSCRAAYLSLSEPGTYTFNITSPVDKPEGFGYLAGEFPDGITTRLDTPISATIKVLHTASDGRMGKVAEVVSNPDGTWAVHGLDSSKKFDVICSLPGFNDLIWSEVYPTTYPYAVILTDNLELGVDSLSLTGVVAISGGTPPYSLEVLGSPPPGLTFSLSEAAITASGTSDQQGSFTWRFRVTDSADFTTELVVTKGPFIDKHWASVIALLPFNAEDSAATSFSNKAGDAWTPSTTGQASIVTDAEGSDGRMLSLLGTSSNSTVRPSSGTIPYKLFAQSLTLELTLKNHTKSDAWIFGVNGGSVTWGSGDSALDLLIVTLGGVLQFQARNNTSTPQAIVGAAPLVTTSAVKLALSYDQPSGTMRGYVNGQKIGEAVLTSPLSASSTRQIRLGGAAGASNATYMSTAKFDEFRLTMGVARMTGDSYPISSEPFYYP